MIGIIGAMAKEVESLIATMKQEKTETISGITFYVGTLCGQDVVIAKCGVGKVCAAVCAQTMIFHFGADTLINSGVAGALDTSLSIGDIVIATSLVQHDVDTSPLGDPVGYISELKKIEMPTSSALVDLAEKVAQKQNVRYHKGVIASGDCFVAAPETKQTIRQRFGAKACEMEGGAMAQVCQMNDVPFVVLRAISDTADDRASMDYPTFVAIAAEKMAKLVKEVLKEM